MKTTSELPAEIRRDVSAASVAAKSGVTMGGAIWVEPWSASLHPKGGMRRFYFFREECKMITVTLKNGEEKRVEAGTTAYAVA